MNRANLAVVLLLALAVVLFVAGAVRYVGDRR